MPHNFIFHPIGKNSAVREKSELKILDNQFIFPHSIVKKKKEGRMNGKEREKGKEKRKTHL